MGRVGTCADNAAEFVQERGAYGTVTTYDMIATAMESFFSLSQKNVLDTRRWNTREELRLAIVTWIETNYHRKRRQRGLSKLTPTEFETIHTAANAAKVGPKISQPE